MKNQTTRAKFSKFSTLLTICVLIAVILVDAVVILLTDRFNLRLDLTSTSAYTLSEDCKEIIDSVDEPINIYVLNDENSFIRPNGSSKDRYYTQANTMIKLIAAENDNINLQYVNLAKNPNFSSNYSQYELADNYVIVESEDRVSVLETIDLFNTTSTYEYTVNISSSKAEQAITGAILTVTSDDFTKITVLSGHDEYTCDPLTSILINNNYELSTTNIVSSDSIDNDISMAILCGPQTDYTQAELDKLEAWLYNNGEYGHTLMYFADATQPELPNLESFLTEWGIKVEKGTIFEGDSSLRISDVFYAVNTFANNQYTEGSVNKNLMPTLPYCRPLSQVETSSNIKVTKLIYFSEQSGIYSGSINSGSFDESDITFSSYLDGMMLASSSVTVDGESRSSNVVVCGTVNFINEDLLSNGDVGNENFIMDLVSTLTDRGDGVYISSKKVGNGYLNITSTNQNMLGILFLVVVPAAVLICGVVVFLRRRHL